MKVIIGIHNKEQWKSNDSPESVKPDVETFSIVDVLLFREVGVLLLDGDSVVTS